MELSKRERRAMGFSAANQVIEEVVEETAIPRGVLIGHRRTRTLVAARWYAIQRVRNETSLSLEEIGELFGRHHTSIMHALR